MNNIFTSDMVSFLACDMMYDIRTFYKDNHEACRAIGYTQETFIHKYKNDIEFFNLYLAFAEKKFIPYYEPMLYLTLDDTVGYACERDALMHREIHRLHKELAELDKAIMKRKGLLHRWRNDLPSIREEIKSGIKSLKRERRECRSNIKMFEDMSLKN